MKFLHVGNAYQLSIEDGRDLADALVLDEALWVAMSAPVKAYTCDPKALAYIDRHINRPVRVTELVAHLHVSRRLLEIRFREILNCGVNETIVSRRLDHYRRQLLHSKLSARAVARACGFSDMSYLTRTFKARFKRTPSELRGGTCAS